MNLKTLQHLEDAVDSETGWRKRELTTVRFEAELARNAKQHTALRAGVALLYAHWEGWIKRISEHYIGFVSEQRLRYDQLNQAFLALTLKAKMDELSKTNQPAIQIDFARFLRKEMQAEARFGSRRSINTQANLSSEVLKRITISLGIDHTPYDMHSPLIDQQMLKRRNQIAHGEYLNLRLEDFLVLHEKVVDLLGRFTTDILNSAAQKLYLA